MARYYNDAGEHECDYTRDVAAAAVVGLGLLAFIAFGAYAEGKKAALRTEPAPLCEVQVSDGELVQESVRDPRVPYLVIIKDTIYTAASGEIPGDKVPCAWLDRKPRV